MTNYKIVNLKGKIFKGGNNVECEIKSGFGLYVEDKGLISFVGLNDKNGVKTPYINKKKVLQSIIDSGGLINFEGVEFINL